jgi:DNA modification methylase
MALRTNGARGQAKPAAQDDNELAAKHMAAPNIVAKPKMEWNRLHQGDCIEGLGRLPAESVDLVFADPPFNIDYEYDVYRDNRSGDQYVDWTKTWGLAVKRVLKPDGTFWLAIGDDYAAQLKLLFQDQLGFHCRSWVVWYYTFGVNCTKKFSRSHTHLFHFVMNPKKFTFNSEAIRVPSARQLVYNDARGVPEGRLPDDTWILRPQDLPEGFQPDEDTWFFSRVCGTFKERAGWHGCQMPEQLLGRIIRVCSSPDEIVVDPFGGSGTTLTVAKKLGRRWLGFELSTNYAAKIQARLDAAEVGQALEGAEEPKVSAPPTPAINGKARANAKRKRPSKAETLWDEKASP